MNANWPLNMYGQDISPVLVQPIQFCLFNIAWTWIASLVTGNVSQVDRIWTFLPTVYTAYYAFYPLLDWADPAIKLQGVCQRTVLMFLLQVLWMVRLSYNTWRRGLFSLNDEDYRWEITRKNIPPWLFQIFNLFFISIAQNILLFLLGLPAHSALVRGPQDLGVSDAVLAILALTTLALEFTADNQQWSYQNFKAKGVINSNEWPGAQIQWTEDDRQRGFVTRGLWAYSRHPNCACEQSFWYIMTFFPILTAGHLPSDSISSTAIRLLPALSLGLLFISSTIFTESISSAKYPEYAAYQSRVGMFWPFSTLLKKWYLNIVGERERIDRMVWGPVKGKRVQ